MYLKCFQWLFFSLFLALAPLTVAAQSLPDVNVSNALMNNPERLLQVQGLLDTLSAKGGNLPVIVELNISFLPEGKLSGAQAVSDQRTSIARTQDYVVNSLQGLPVENSKKFGTIPFMGLRVDQKALNGLINSPWVKNISEDRLDKPSLNLSVPRIGGDQAWAAGYTGTGWAVAVLDTGVDKVHPFLAGKVVEEACYSTTNATASSTSVCPGGVSSSTAAGSGVNCDLAVSGCAHGTHVAGIATGSGVSFSGVAKGADLIAVQVFSRFDDLTQCGGVPTCVLSYNTDQVFGLERVYALRDTYDIASVNMSIGGGYNTSQQDCDTNNSARKAIMDNLKTTAGIATVISSGNDGYTDAMGAPGCISTAVSVGATTDADLVAETYSNSVSFLDVLAPGSSINSSVPGGTYSSWNGTSMAAPHVAGCWALIKQAAPNASVDQILTALKATGTPIADSRNSIFTPRINCYAALQQVAGLPPSSNFPWPMFLSGITSQKTPKSYWSALSYVFCSTSSATFSLTSSGVTKKSICQAGGCAGGAGTFEGWVTTTPGTKFFSWSLVAPTCGTWTGSFNHTLGAGRNYSFFMNLNASNQPTVYVTPGVGTPTTASYGVLTLDGAGLPVESNGTLEAVDQKILDAPTGTLSSSR